MTTSTNGQICYGVLFDEDHEFPWDEWEDGIEEWWLYRVCDYHNPFELFDERGNWLDGAKPPEQRIREYYDHRHTFLDSHPIPVRLVNYCSGDYPMYIVAAPSSVIIASRGYPEAIGVRSFATVTEEEAVLLIEFCRKHLGVTEGPRWWLSSYWS